MNFLEISQIPLSILSAFLGIGLAAAAGFRVFVPLFVSSLAVHYGQGVIPLAESWQWVGDWPALITLGMATIVEIFSYYIPLVDHALDAISVPLASVAGTLLMASQLTDFNAPVVAWALAIIAGGGTAAAIKSATAGTRATSTVTTAGIGNMFISTAETGISALLSVVSIFLPFVAFILVVLILFFIYRFMKRVKNYFRTAK